MLLIAGSAYAELTIEYPTTNEVRISRNGAVLLVKATSTNSCVDYVFFNKQCVLSRYDAKDYTAQVFPPNALTSVALVDKDHDGHPDRVELYTMDGAYKTLHDLLHIGTDGRLEPFSDQELQAEQTIWTEFNESLSKQNATSQPMEK